MPRTGRVTKEIARAREERAWELRLKGLSHAQIADHLSVERTTVTKILQRVRKRVQAKVDQDVDQHRSEMIAKYEKIYAEAMVAWEASKGQSKTAIQKDSEKFGKETSVKVEEEHGDSRYLQAAMGALKDLQKLVGLDIQPRLQEASASAKINSLSAEERAMALQDLVNLAKDRSRKRISPVYVEIPKSAEIVQ